MFKLARAHKAYREAGSLNEQIGLFGFIDDHTFLTKSGDVGIVLAVEGVDYECLDGAEIDNRTKRLESAFKVFDEKCHIYQYLFKRNHESIPYQTYANPVVNAAIQNRMAYLQSKADSLYSLCIYYVVLFEGFHARRALFSALAGFREDPQRTCKELRALLSTEKQVLLIDSEIAKAQALVNHKVRSFILQVNDFLPVQILSKHEAFRVLKRILNFAPLKVDCARLKHDTMLDFYLPDSHLECHRGYLRMDDYFVKVLTLKEPSAHTSPLIFKKLLEVQSNFYVVTEWRKESHDKVRGEIRSRRRHFHNTKRSLISQMNLSDAPLSAQDVLIDDSKEAMVRDLGEALKQIEVAGSYFGKFSLTVVIYDLDLAKVETACADFYKVFSVHDAQLYEERYNLLNAYLATVPGNYAFNLRQLYITNTNYADYSFLFTLHSGLLRALAQRFGGDTAATDSTRVFRLPGFSNKKYQQDFVVSFKVETPGAPPYHADDFARVQSTGRAPDRDRQPHTNPHSAVRVRHSQSERDYAYAIRKLNQGDDPEKIIRDMASYRSVDQYDKKDPTKIVAHKKSNPRYYAEYTVTQAMVELGITRQPRAGRRSAGAAAAESDSAEMGPTR